MQFDKLVTIQSYTTSADGYGTLTPSWSDLANRWANVQDQGGGELYRAQKIDATVDAVITLRERVDGMIPRWRVTWNDRTFDVKAVLSGDDRLSRRGQILHCTEHVDA